MSLCIFLNKFITNDKTDEMRKEEITQLFQNNGYPVKDVNLSDDKNKKIKIIKIDLKDDKKEEEIIKNSQSDESKFKYKGKTLNIKRWIDISQVTEIQITNFPDIANKENIKQKCQEFGNVVDTNNNPRHFHKGLANRYYVDIENREEAQKIINNLDGYNWDVKKLKVEFTDKSQGKSEESNTSKSSEKPKKVPPQIKRRNQSQNRSAVSPTSSTLIEFYQNSDYDEVTNTLKSFVFEICKYLSTNSSQSPTTQDKINTDNQENKNSKDDETSSTESSTKDTDANNSPVQQEVNNSNLTETDNN